jgi:hypothetical protein
VNMRLVIGTAQGIHYLDSELVNLTKQRITALAGPWAITDGRRLWHLAPDGPPVEIARFDAGPPATCLLPLDDAILVGTAEGHLIRFEDQTAASVEAFDTAEGRNAWHTPWGGPPDVRSMTAGVDALYVNVHVGGILASLDNGHTWAPTGLDIDTDVHQVLAIDHVVLAALGHGGLACSKDAGQSWTVTTRGLHSSYCRAVAAADESVLLSASTGPRTRQAALYRGCVGGDDFERCQSGLPQWFTTNIDSGCLVMEKMNAAFGTDDGSVFVSTDAGASWTQAVGKLPPVTVLQYAPT